MLAQQNEPFAQQSDAPRTVLAILEIAPDDKAAALETSRESAQEPGLALPVSEATAEATEPTAGNLPDAQKLAAPSTPEEPSPVATSEAAQNAAITSEPEKAAQAGPEFSLDKGSATVERAAPPAVASEPETRIAAVSETAATTAEPSTATSEPINAPAVGPQPTTPALQIAALGGSPEATDTQAREKEASNETRAKSYRNFIRNRLRARRAKERRRLAHRAHIARPVAVQQQSPTGFGFPSAPTNIPGTENPYRF